MIKIIRDTLELVKFSHTIFALPFALSAYTVATKNKWQLNQLFWVLLCLISARTAAMTFNRLVDANIDTLNPRTKDRHLPSGRLKKSYVLGLTLLMSTLFIFGAYKLNPLALALSPLCLALLFLYSLTKRFTHYTQIFLGVALGMAPLGAHIAATGSIALSPILLGMAVLFWVAGFDLLYSLQDLDFDREQGLYSLSVKLGLKKTFFVAKLFHGLFLILLVSYGALLGMGMVYWLGIIISAGFIFYQHWTLKEDLKNIQAAFFTANGLLSVFFFVFVWLDLYF